MPSVIPEEPTDLGADINNNLTRPEAMSATDLHDLSTDRDGGRAGLDALVDSDLSPQVESALEEFDRIVEFESSDSDTDRLRRGDLIEIDVRMNNPLFGVYLGRSSKGLIQYYTNLGGVFLASKTRATFKVNDFIDPELLDPFDEYLAQDIGQTPASHTAAGSQLPLHVVGPVLARMKHFENEVERVYRQYFARIEAAQSRMSHPTDMIFKRVDDVARDLLGTAEMVNGVYPPHVVFAVEQALVKKTFGFVYANRATHAYDHLLAIYAKDDVAALLRVQEWVRAYQEAAALEAGGFSVPRVVLKKTEPLRSFAEKARIILQYSRSISHRSPDGSVVSFARKEGSPPEPPKQSLPSFSASDSDVIRVLKLQGLANAFQKHPTLRAVPGTIMRLAGDYGASQTAESSIMKFLVELGVVDPFYTPGAFDHHLYGPAQELDKPLAEATALVNAGSSPNDVVGMHDSMADLRKDWGDMPVFCIDAETTLDMDDAISLEPIEGSDGEVWVHVHIAHLSSMIAPDSLLGRVARHRDETIHLLASRVTMLPDWVATSASLGKDRAVLTFSMRLDAHSNVLDAQIQPGIIRNVITISADKVDSQVFGNEKKVTTVETVTLGEEEPAKRRTTDPETLSESEKSLLQRLYAVAQGIYAHNPAAAIRDIINVRRPKKTTNSYWARINEGTQFASIASTPSSPTFCRRDPVVALQRYQGLEAPGVVRPSRSIVEQTMLLACTVAGRWAAERGLPLVYTGTREPDDGIDDTVAHQRKLIEIRDMRKKTLRNLIKEYGMPRRVATPLPHRLIGVPAWARVTNPLRRYLDLVNHWQIDAALRQEASTGQLISSDPDRSFLPFDEGEIGDIIHASVARGLKRHHYHAEEREHWKFLFFARAYLLGEAELPPLLYVATFEVGESYDINEAMLLAYNVTGHVDIPSMGIDGHPVRSFEKWYMKVKSIDMEKRIIHLTPHRRIAEAKYYIDSKMGTTKPKEE